MVGSLKLFGSKQRHRDIINHYVLVNYRVQVATEGKLFTITTRIDQNIKIKVNR